MNRSQGLNRRHALKLLAGGGAGATALTKMAGGAGLAAMLGAVPDPLEAAQVATRRGLPRLKITDIKVIKTQVGNTHMTNAKVFTSEAGLYGVGCGGHAERQSIVAETIEQFLKPAVVGRYADEIEDIWQMAWLAPYWRASVDANNAMSAIDGALWDIMGKRAGMPVHNLLGGKVRPALPMFANVNGRDLKELEDNARARIAEGYKHLRVGAVGGDGSGGGRAEHGGAVVAWSGRRDHGWPGKPPGWRRARVARVWRTRPDLSTARSGFNVHEQPDHVARARQKDNRLWGRFVRRSGLPLDAERSTRPGQGASSLSGCSGSRSSSRPRTSHGTRCCARKAARRWHGARSRSANWSGCRLSPIAGSISCACISRRAAG